MRAREGARHFPAGPRPRARRSGAAPTDRRRPEPRAGNDTQAVTLRQGVGLWGRCPVPRQSSRPEARHPPAPGTAGAASADDATPANALSPTRSRRLLSARGAVHWVDRSLTALWPSSDHPLSALWISPHPRGRGRHEMPPERSPGQATRGSAARTHPATTGAHSPGRTLRPLPRHPVATEPSRESLRNEAGPRRNTVGRQGLPLQQEIRKTTHPRARRNPPHLGSGVGRGRVGPVSAEGVVAEVVHLVGGGRPQRGGRRGPRRDRDR